MNNKRISASKNFFEQLINMKFEPNFIVTWLSVFLISALRAAEIFKHPSFWAEDGTFFFKDAMELGFTSIYTPIVGHYHTVPRILAYLSTFFPVEHTPLFIIITAGIVSSACCAYFIRDGFAWIIKNKWNRFFCAILISFLPGSEEVFFAYCTMNYIFFIFITLYFLENYQGSSSLTLRRELLFSTIWFSAGQGIVFIPLLFFQIWKKKWLKLIPLATLCISIFINLQASHRLENKLYNASTFSLKQTGDLALVYFDNIFMRTLIRPFMSTMLAQNLAKQNDILFYSIAILLLFFAVRLIFKSKIYKTQAHLVNNFLIMMLTTPLIFPLIYLVRGYTTHQLFKYEINFIGRYAMQPFLVTSLLAVFIFKSIPTKEKWQKFTLNWLALLVFLNIFHYDLRFVSDRIYAFENAWPEQATAIEIAIDKVRISKTSAEALIPGPIKCRPSWWDGAIPDITIKPLKPL